MKVMYLASIIRKREMTMSKFIRSIGTVIGISGMLSGLVLSLFVVYEMLGGGATVLSLILFPLTFAVIPIYMLLVHGSWNLLLLSYGSIFVGQFLRYVAARMEAQHQALHVPAFIAEQTSTDAQSIESEVEGYQRMQWWIE